MICGGGGRFDCRCCARISSSTPPDSREPAHRRGLVLLIMTALSDPMASEACRNGGRAPSRLRPVHDGPNSIARCGSGWADDRHQQPRSEDLRRSRHDREWPPSAGGPPRCRRKRIRARISPVSPPPGRAFLVRRNSNARARPRRGAASPLSLAAEGPPSCIRRGGPSADGRRLRKRRPTGWRSPAPGRDAAETLERIHARAPDVLAVARSPVSGAKRTAELDPLCTRSL